jgi:hypothetical protein
MEVQGLSVQVPLIFILVSGSILMILVASVSFTQVGLHIGERRLQRLMLILLQLPWKRFWNEMVLLCFMYARKFQQFLLLSDHFCGSTLI